MHHEAIGGAVHPAPRTDVEVGHANAGEHESRHARDGHRGKTLRHGVDLSRVRAVANGNQQARHAANPRRRAQMVRRGQQQQQRTIVDSRCRMAERNRAAEDRRRQDARNNNSLATHAKQRERGPGPPSPRCNRREKMRRRSHPEIPGWMCLCRSRSGASPSFQPPPELA